MRDVQRAMRRLLSTPAVTLASILTLAMAIGAAAATWSVLSAVLLKPLPIRDPHRVVVAGAVYGAGTNRSTQGGVTYLSYAEVVDHGIFDSVAAVWSSPLTLPLGDRDRRDPTLVLFVSRAFFDVLGVPAQIGRGFADSDDRHGAAPVAVLSDRYWRTALGADPGVIGRSLTLGNRAVTVVGVAVSGFRGLNLAQAPAMFLPLDTIADFGSPTTNYFADPQHGSSPTAGLGIIGRLRDGQTVDEARSRLAALSAPPGARGSVPWYVIEIGTAAIPAVAREGTQRFARLLATTVALILLIGCSTVGLLLLVRTEARRDEFATCLALGASRGQLARGIVIEGALLTAAAALLAPLVASWLSSALSTFQLPGGIALGLLDLTLDRNAIIVILVGAAGVTLLISVIAGVGSFRADIASTLRGPAGVTPRIARRGTRAVLVATQVAVAVTLITGTGVLARSLIAALDLNRRIDSARIVTIDPMPLAAHGYSSVRAATLFDDLRARLAGNRLIRSVATSASVGGMAAGGTLAIDGVPRAFPTFVAFHHVDDSYFAAMQMRILRGRQFSTDDVGGAPLAGVVSESFARMIGDGEDVLGRHIVMTFGRKLDIAIVGVVDDLFTDIRSAEPLALYMPMAQQASPVVNRALVFRATDDVEAARQELLLTVRQLDPNLRVPASLTLDERLMRQMAPQQFGLLVLGSLGGIAFLLAILGTYVLAETMAVMRMREIGIRAALGASTRSLIVLMLRESALLVSLGLCAGLLLSWLGANIIRGLLFRIQPLDPVTIGIAATVIVLVSLAVSLRPGLRVARIDLAEVLRVE